MNFQGQTTISRVYPCKKSGSFQSFNLPGSTIFYFGTQYIQIYCFNFYPHRTPPFQKIHEEKNQTASPPNNYSPSNYLISLSLVCWLAELFPVLPLGFLRTPVRTGITLLTRLPCCFFAHACAFIFFPFAPSGAFRMSYPAESRRVAFARNEVKGKR